MAASTDEEFDSILDDELAWRKIELHSLASQLERSARDNKDSPATRALARAMAALLYAHWEGFTKAVLDAYLRLILRRKPPAMRAADGLLMAHVDQLFKRMNSGDSSAQAEIVEMVRGGSSARLRLVRAKVVATGSNLRYSVLKNLFEVFGLPLDEFATKANLIDVLLCDRRNEIAHGRANFPEPTEVLALHKQVLEMMDDIRRSLQSSLQARGYLRHS